MKFSKKAKSPKIREEIIQVKEGSSKRKTKETAGTIVLAGLMFTSALALSIIHPFKDAVEHNEVMAPPNMIITTADTTASTSTTTSVLTTTKAAAQVTTTVATTTTSNVEATSSEVPATEPTVVPPVHEEKTVETEIQRVEVQETIPDPEPTPEVIEEETVNEEPTVVASQEYYSDDGDYGWSHVGTRYTAPSLIADQERYHTANEYVTEYERILLVNIVASEYGSDWISVAEKAKVVAVVMNRRANGYWGDSIESVLSYSGQFQGYNCQSWFYRSVTPTCIDAVDYYFLHQDDSMYYGIKYISGGGSYNTFY